VNETKHQKITGHCPEFSDADLAATTLCLLLALFNDTINSHSAQMNGDRDTQSKNYNWH
jgi:hypothetical protein